MVASDLALEVVVDGPFITVADPQSLPGNENGTSVVMPQP